MAFTTEPLPSATAGWREILNGLVASFSDHDTSMSTLSFINTFLNTLIGLLLTVTIIAFFGYLAGWYFSARNSDLEKRSVRGAMRTFLALFLMLNVWSIIALLNKIFVLSDVTAYVVFILAFFLLGFWSLFSAGDSLTALLSHGLNTGLDEITVIVRKHFRWAKKLHPQIVRFMALVVAGCALTIVSFWFVYGPQPVPVHEPVHSSETYAMPVIREAGDAVLDGNHYTNTRYGIDVTYPDEWTLSEATSGASLISAYDEGDDIYSYLNAGIYPDLVSGSADDYTAAFWRVDKIVQSSFVERSEGIISSIATKYNDVGSTTATLLQLSSYWAMPDTTIAPVMDSYLFFGNGPVYFTLQVGTANMEVSLDELNAESDRISQAIRVSAAQK